MRKIVIDRIEKQDEKRIYQMPWDSDSTCYNFKSPDEFLPSSETETIRGSKEVLTLVIKCPLEDYTFIEGMDGLRYLYICDGSGLTDISFVRGLAGLKQLYLDGTSVSDLTPICELVEARNRCAEEARREQRPMWQYGMQGIYISSEHDLPKDAINGGLLSLGEVIINGDSAERRRRREKAERMRAAREKRLNSK